MPTVSHNKLTAKAVESAKFTGKARKVFDGDGLFLLVNEAGRYWRWKYRMDGKEKTLALGVYPAVGLQDARRARDDAKRQRDQGVDPSAYKRHTKAARVTAGENSVERIAREWFAVVHERTVTAGHAGRNLRRLELYVFPKIGRMPIADVEPGYLLTEVLRPLEKMGTGDTAHRCKNLCSQFWRYAVQSGRAKHDITADLRGALVPVKEAHFAAIVEPKEFGTLLRMLDAYRGQYFVQAAFKLAPMLLKRPNELRCMEWAALDLDTATWNFQPSKGGAPMIVSLPRQAVEVLRSLEPITGGGRFVFPCRGHRASDRPMSENALSAALVRMGLQGQHTWHGFRASARTMLAEVLGFPIEVIEMELGHAVKDANGRAYNRTTYLEQRREMMQAWADYLDELRGA